MQLTEAGDHIVVGNTIYGGTFALLQEFLQAKMGLKVSFVDVADHKAVEGAFTPRTKLLYAETMSNPTLVVADIPRLAEIAHRHGAKLVVDNTFSPLIVSPAQQGADIVVHSLTKFIGGASDIIAGVICAEHDFIASLEDVHKGALMLVGSTMDPGVAFHISLRLPHLGLRMAEHSRRALIFAERLQNLGLSVVYPGLPSHPHHELLDRLRNDGFGYGGIFGVDMETKERADALMETLQNDEGFGYMAVSLGYFDTLMSCSASSTSSELSEEDQKKSGISPGLVRISIGYTGSLEQRWSQFERGLRKLGLAGKKRPAMV
jgi:methionine-gamma-lyase